MDPKTRRTAAIWLLVVSFMAGNANMVGFFTGFVSHELMDAITNYLSWLAITITCLDIVFTADVRVVQDETETPP